MLGCYSVQKPCGKLDNGFSLCATDGWKARQKIIQGTFFQMIEQCSDRHTGALKDWCAT